MAEEATGWRFTKDPATGVYNEMATSDDTTLIATGNFSKVVRQLIAYTNKTRIPTYMLFAGIWYYLLINEDGTITVAHNRHDADIEEDMLSLGIDKPLEDWNLEERQSYLRIRDKKERYNKYKLRQLGRFIKNTGTKVEIVEDWKDSNSPEAHSWWNRDGS